MTEACRHGSSHTSGSVVTQTQGCVLVVVRHTHICNVCNLHQRQVWSVDLACVILACKRRRRFYSIVIRSCDASIYWSGCYHDNKVISCQPVRTSIVPWKCGDISPPKWPDEPLQPVISTICCKDRCTVATVNQPGKLRHCPPRHNHWFEAPFTKEGEKWNCSAISIGHRDVQHGPVFVAVTQQIIW